ncbi:DNA helicase mcm9 [Binucleata daphniae]
MKNTTLSLASVHEPVLDIFTFIHNNPYAAQKILTSSLEYEGFLSKKKLVNIPFFLLKDTKLTHFDYGNFISLKGTVVKIGLTKYKDIKTIKTCNSCSTKNEIESVTCKDCGDNNLSKSNDLNEIQSHQIIKIQELENEQMHYTECLMSVNLCENIKIGQKILVSGIVVLNKRNANKNDMQNLRYCLKVLDVKKENKQIDFIYTSINKYLCVKEKRKHLINMFCTEIYGMHDAKLGLILSMVGQIRTKMRMNSHILLVGETGTGKSTLLRFCSKLITPSRYINGIGTSEVGLTACAIKEDGEWSLDTGALIVTDGGLCCIDNVNMLEQNEKNGLLEAMEQQTVSVAKAGINAKFQACCTVIGSVTPKDAYKRINIDNLGVSKPLLSRFDLILHLIDLNENNEEIADKILKNKPEKLNQKLKEYLEYIKMNVIEEECEVKQILYNYCKLKQELAKKGQDTNFCRMLEGLLRLTIAHGKINLNSKITKEDAYVAILLYETSLKSSRIIEFDAQKVFVDACYFLDVVERYEKIM